MDKSAYGSGPEPQPRSEHPSHQAGAEGRQDEAGNENGEETEASQPAASPRSGSPAAALEADEGELPRTYNEARLVLLPVDPYLVHAYWEVIESTVDEMHPGLTSGKITLRFYEAEQALAGSTGSSRSFDVAVDLSARNWYVHLQKPSTAYYAELSYRSEQGSDVSLARSNVVQAPRAWPADDSGPETYLRVDEHQKVEIVEPPFPSLLAAAASRTLQEERVHQPVLSPPSRRVAKMGPADFKPEERELTELEFPTPVIAPQMRTAQARDMESERLATIIQPVLAWSPDAMLAPEFPLPSIVPSYAGPPGPHQHRITRGPASLDLPDVAKHTALRIGQELSATCEARLQLGVSSGSLLRLQNRR